MKIEDIKNTEDFIAFLSKQKDDDAFLQHDSEEKSKTICQTAFSSNVLYILPATHDLNNIKHYNNLKFVTINNFKISQKAFEILNAHKDKLENVKFLNIWNIKQDDLQLLKLFPNVTHLLISYIRKADFSYAGLDYLENLETLVLMSANNITDFNFLNTSQKEKIKHLHLTYAAKLTKFDGINDFKNLETLTLQASTPESRKMVTLENLNGIEKLAKLHDIEINYFKFNMEELKEKLKQLKKLKQYKVQHQIYKNV